MVERVIRILKEQCIHRHRLESPQHAIRVIGDWIQFYNHRRPHQALRPLPTMRPSVSCGYPRNFLRQHSP
nr:integrase core domain-containing protein [Pseudoxanthomonas sp.]